MGSFSAHFGAILGPCGAAVGAVSCPTSCSRRLHGSRVTSQPQFWGGNPIFLPFPPPPSLHPPPFHPARTPRATSAPMHTEGPLHKQGPHCTRSPLGFDLREFGAFSAHFGGHSGWFVNGSVDPAAILAVFPWSRGSFGGNFRLSSGDPTKSDQLGVVSRDFWGRFEGLGVSGRKLEAVRAILR